MSTPLRLPFTAAILAGGRSGRMGRDKASIAIQGRSLLERQMDLVRSLGASEVLVSLRTDSELVGSLAEDSRIVRDRVSDCGPLGGIEACLEAAHNQSVLVLAVDLPAMTPEYLQTLMTLALPNRGVLAEHRGIFEPLASLYTKTSLDLARQHLDARQLSLQSFATRCVDSFLAVRWPVPSKLQGSLVNWNEPSDWTPPASGAADEEVFRLGNPD